MAYIILKARAKINWTLDVLERRRDGYHNIETIMQSIELHDRITIMEWESGISISTNCRDIPVDSTNLAWKAAKLVKDTYKKKAGLKILLEKNIPVSAGLAGGSADAAAILVGLNRLWSLGLDFSEIKNMGGLLGADVPFCIMGGTVLAQGIGDILTPLPAVEDIWLLLVKPDFDVSTKEIYNSLDIEKIDKKPDTTGMIDCLSRGDLEGIGQSMSNVLENVTTAIHPEIDSIKLDLRRQGALGCLMSGSGPSVYGIFAGREAARKAYQYLIKRGNTQVYLTRTSCKGIDVVEEG